MYKVALMGQIHEDGIKILNESGFNYKEINDFSYEGLIRELSDVNAIAISTAELTKEILQECKFNHHRNVSVKG